MELRLLEYFMAVCETLHFTKAAEKLGISQPTLSHQIKLLEDRLGTKLFRRSGKKVYVTEAGKCLLEHSEKIFYELDQAYLKISEIQGLRRGRLAIGCSGNHLLISAVISFNKKYPEIELSIQDLTTKETVEGILKNQLDIGVVFTNYKHHQLEITPLFTEELCLIVSTSHQLANWSSIKLKELKDVPLVLLPKRFYIRQFLNEICEQSGFTLKPRIELTTLSAMEQMTRVNNLPTILPKSYIISQMDTNIKIIPIVEPTPQQTVGIVYRKRHLLI